MEKVRKSGNIKTLNDQWEASIDARKRSMPSDVGNGAEGVALETS